MTETQVQKMFVELSELMQQLNLAIDLTHDIQRFPFEAITPEVWEDIQTGAEAFRTLFEIQKQAIQAATPALADDNLRDHAFTVMLANQ